MSRRAIEIVAVLAVVQLALFVVYRMATREDTAVAVIAMNEESPALVLETADGERRTLREWRGRPVLLHFWGTWCPPCREELPAVLERADQTEVAVLAVSVDRDWKEIRAFLDSEPPPAVVRASFETAEKRFGVETLPVTFVVDEKGRLRARFEGARDWRSAALWGEVQSMGR